MLPLFYSQRIKRIVTVFLSASLVVSGIGGALQPTLSPVSGQKTQQTDIFTGQFIPAYLGAAYDPSEAYKQMAGLPVYVYAYDTFDKIVNNYVFKTQIRADGSFQAAGLANASHYGVCVKVADNNTLLPFRPPIPGPNGDNLETVFAYNQEVFPPTPINPRDQTGLDTELSNVNPSQPDGQKGCRTFLTSSRTVDIANHVNIFPLVPTTVLSVIIKDSILGSAQTDLYNTNSPYEVYAQRITLNSVPTSDCLPEEMGKTCKVVGAIDNAMVNGPIIRGRTIPYIAEGASYQGATIFQAYAPKGVYAITYWRPDSRDIKNTVTYLTFNGSQQLNTPYNGIAFENVVSAGNRVKIGNGADITTSTTTNQWRLSTRNFNEDNNTRAFAWHPKSGNLNIWGMTTASKGGSEVPMGGGTIKIGNKWFGFLDPMTRVCSSNQSGTVSAWGIYLFSSACTPNNDPLPTTTTEISVNSFSSSTEDITYSSKDNLSVTSSGNRGPSRYNISLLSTPKSGVELNIYQRSGPITFNLTVDGKTYRNVATSDSSGKLIIPGVYFAKNPMAQYTVWANTPSASFGTKSKPSLSFVIDGSTLKSPYMAMNYLGTVDLTPKPSAVSSVLAALNFSNLFNALHIPAAFAKYDGSADDFNPDDVQLFLDSGVIDAINPNGFLTYNNYDLTQVEMVLPQEASGDRENYVAFNRYGDGNNKKDGLITNADNLDTPQVEAPAEGANARIVGVRLKQKTGIDYEWQSAFDAYQAFTRVENTMPLTLRVKFEKTNVAYVPSEDNPDDQTSAGQDASSILPTQLESEWPVTLVKDANGAFKIQYEPVAVVVRPPGCDFGAHFYQVGDKFKETICSLVSGTVNIVGRGAEFIAVHLTTVDPLQYGITRDAWNIMRNFVNGLAVVLLIIAGIAIMLRYEPQWFNLQSVLTRLITTIVVVNFSILIIQFAIDIANVFSTGGYFFLINTLNDPNAAPGAGIGAAVAAMAALSAYVFTIAVALPGPALLAGLVALLAVFLGLIYVMGKAVYFWIIRQIVLIICIVAAPIALSARVLPGTQSFYTRWRTMITRVLVSQIMFAFVLALAMAMLRYSVTGGASFMASLVGIGIAIGLFWYTTKFPAMAMAALESGVGFAVESNLKKGLAGFKNGMMRASMTMTDKANIRREREKLMGIDRDKIIQAYDEEMKAKGLGRVRRSIGRRALSANMTVRTGIPIMQQNMDRNRRDLARRGKIGALLGVTGEDLDKSEAAARTKVKSEYDERIQSVAPHILAERRKEELKETMYKPADQAADALSLSKLTDARNNMSVLESGYDATFDYFDPQTGEVDPLGHMGDMGDATRVTKYGTGYAAAWKNVRQLNPIDNPKAVAAVDHLANSIKAAQADPTTNIGTKEGFNKFYETFRYGTANNAKDSWVQFYNDTGMPVPEGENVNNRDLKGKAFEDVVIRPASMAGAQAAGWGSSIRQSVSQVTSTGVADRSRIPTMVGGVVLREYAIGFVAPGVTLGDNLRYLTGVVPEFIPGKEAGNVRDALAVVEAAYRLKAMPPAHPNLASGTNPSNNEYKSAIKTLEHAGYGVDLVPRGTP